MTLGETGEVERKGLKKYLAIATFRRRVERCGGFLRTLVRFKVKGIVLASGWKVHKRDVHGNSDL